MKKKAKAKRWGVMTKKRTAPAPQTTKSLEKYYRDFLAGKVDPGITCHFELKDGSVIDQPVRSQRSIK